MHAGSLSLIAAGCLLSYGCSRPAEIPGGTPGIVHVDGTPLADVQVTAWRTRGGDPAEATPVAFGISSASGRFELRRPETLKAVWLEPGEFCFTVESVGDLYFIWPAEYGSPERTPLRRTWSDGDREIDLNVPMPSE